MWRWIWANALELEKYEDLSTVKSLHLLTNKPILYVANLSENEIVNNIENKYVKRLEEYAKSKGETIRVCASIEQEISSLPHEEEKAF